MFLRQVKGHHVIIEHFADALLVTSPWKTNCITMKRGTVLLSCSSKPMRYVTCRARCVHLCGMILPSVLKLTARGTELPGRLYRRVTASSDTVREKHSRFPELFSSSILSETSTHKKITRKKKKSWIQRHHRLNTRASDCCAALRNLLQFNVWKQSRETRK